jgi:predicted  nucleic acid-binding Zn-ribbon protein
VLLQIPEGIETRTQWGPCTRCGHEWIGLRNTFLPPRGCPRCGSQGWRTPPTRPNSRFPEDDPNPNWEKRRRDVKRERRIEKRRTMKNERARIAALEPAVTMTTPSPSMLTSPPPPSPVAKRAMEQLLGVAPPPRLSEIAPALVAPASVRFAEAPDPMSVVGRRQPIEDNFTNIEAPKGNIFEEPDDGVPIIINEDGSITEVQDADGTIDEQEEEEE